jgi:hypothetical protein
LSFEEIAAVNTQSTEGDWEISPAMTNGKSHMENGKSLPAPIS